MEIVYCAVRTGSLRIIQVNVLCGIRNKTIAYAETEKMKQDIINYKFISQYKSTNSKWNGTSRQDTQNRKRRSNTLGKSGRLKEQSNSLFIQMNVS
jgi:hypothetical protein